MENSYWIQRTGHTEREIYRAFVKTLDCVASDHDEDALALFVKTVYGLEEDNRLFQIDEDVDLESLVEAVERLEGALSRKDYKAIKTHCESIEEDFDMALYESMGAVAEYRATQYQGEVPMSFRAWLYATGRNTEAVELIRSFTKWGMKHTQSLLEGGQGLDSEKPDLLALLGEYEDVCQREGITPEDTYIAIGKFNMDCVRYLWALG